MAVTVEFGQLVEQSGHAVDARVAGADHRDPFAFERRVERPAAEVEFAAHRSGDQLLARNQRGDQVEIELVAGDDGAAFQYLPRLRGQECGAAGADAEGVDDRGIHDFTSAMATVACE